MTSKRLDTTGVDLPVSGSMTCAIENPISLLMISPAETRAAVSSETANPASVPMNASRIATRPRSTSPSTMTTFGEIHQKISASETPSIRRRIFESVCEPKSGTIAKNAVARTMCSTIAGRNG